MDNIANRMFTPADFQHETDKLLIEQLIQSPAMEKLQQFLAENRIEAVYQYYYQSSYVSVTREVSPKMWDMLERASAMFGLQKIPQLYLTRDYQSGAFVSGASEPFIILSSDLLSRLDDDRLLWGILASQTAAVAAGHHQMNYLLWVTDQIGALIPLNIIPLPDVVKQALSGAVSSGLHKWAQWRTFSLDRAFYLATGDYQLTIDQMFLQRMSNGNRKRFGLGGAEDKYRKQKEEFLNDSGLSDVAQKINSFLRDDAWLPIRCREFEQFVAGRAAK